MAEQRHSRLSLSGTGTMIANSSIRTKVIWMLGLTMGLFVLTASSFLGNQREINDARQLADHTNVVLDRTADLLVQLLRQESNLRGYLLTHQEAFLAPYQAAEQSFDSDVAALLKLTVDNAEQQARYHRIADMMQQWRDEVAHPEVAFVQSSPRGDEARAMVATGRGRTMTDAIHMQINQAADTESALLKIRNGALSDQLDNTHELAIAALVLGFVFCVLSLLVAERTLATPMRRLTELTGRLSDGDLDLDVPYGRRGDEIGAIARAIESLRDAALQVRNREWLKNHLTQLGAHASKPREYNEFGQAVLSYLCPLLGAGYGVLLHAHEDGALQAIGGYGYTERRGQARVTRDGLTAECLRRGQPVTLKPVPDDYVRITSSLGNAAPRIVQFWPLRGATTTIGVLELASFAEFDERTTELVTEATAMLGLMLEALGNALRTRELLEESRAQSEELQASEEALRVQQEELRTANEALNTKNEALEEQGLRLRASEEELRAQTEELRTTNESLGEKSRELNAFNDRLLAFQQELEVKNRDLEQASRYKSEFLANMSHELRTPLNSLLILAKDLADNGTGNLTGEQVESAQIVYDSGRNLLNLINDILDLSKIEAGRMDVQWETVELQAITANAERNFRRVAQDRGLRFTVDIAAGLPPKIHSDGSRIAQILTNLLGNAFKFTHQGEVRLTIARADDDALPVLPGALQRERTVALTVQDSGIGIAAEKLARLFQPFEQGDGTTSRRYGGTGLGLSISRALAHLLGGDIVVGSTPGQGSRFTLLLPDDGAVDHAVNGDDTDVAPAHTALATALPVIEVPMPAAEPATVAEVPATEVPRVAQIPDDREQLQPGDTCILVVEDDGAFARVLADMTRRKGYRVLVATDGQSGLALARHYRPTGILLDVDLPVMSGWTVMEQLKADAATRQIPVHFVSANDDVSRGMAMGAVGFVTKPATRESLDAAFQRVLGSSEGTRRKVLVVEDDPVARRAVSHLLSKQPIDLHEADTAADGLDRISTQAYDCIILDLTLPDASGFEFLERLAQRGPVPPVVIYSARELTREEDLRLREYTDSIVIKGAQTPGRLLDEVSLFLHAVKKPSSPTSTAQTPSDLAERTVLVVDDDMRNVFALSKTLRGQGLKVHVAQDGHKALLQLEQHPEIECVLMDVMMPGMDGYEATREIRKQPQWRELPVIAVTAKAMKGDREKCLAAGANDYLTKPIDVDKLLSMMRAWLPPK
ncbi:response regulator [Solimonas marina]|uniref:histidine kinase n=1 Tax=Solimonas marina TaxID=2714601 RepID=A0A969W8D1_9GAMM|nr:response regulator [Solimonas marina]NKF22586.1 response regulator [Solimonas marina]